MSDTPSDESNSPVRVQEAESSQPSPITEERGPSPDSTVFEEGSQSRYRFPAERVSNPQSTLIASQNPCLVNLLNENSAPIENVINQPQALEFGLMDRQSTSAEGLSPNSGRYIEAQQNITDILAYYETLMNVAPVSRELISAPEQMIPDSPISNKDEINPDSTLYEDRYYDQPSTSRATSTSSTNENVNYSESKPILRSLLIQNVSPKRNETNKGEQSSSKVISSTNSNKYLDKNNSANTSLLAGKLRGNENLTDEKRSSLFGATSSANENYLEEREPSSLHVLDSILDLMNFIEEGQQSSDSGQNSEPSAPTVRSTSSPQQSGSIVEKNKTLTNMITDSSDSASTSRSTSSPHQSGSIVEKNPILSNMITGSTSASESTATPTPSPQQSGSIVEKNPILTNMITGKSSASTSAVRQPRQHVEIAQGNQRLTRMITGDSIPSKKLTDTGKQCSASGQRAQRSASASAVFRQRKSGDVVDRNPLLSNMISSSSASTSTEALASSSRQRGDVAKSNPLLSGLITEDLSTNINMRSRKERDSASTSSFQRSGSLSPPCRQRQFGKLREENPILSEMITKDSSVSKNLYNQQDQQTTSRWPEHSSARAIPLSLQPSQIFKKELADNSTAEQSSTSETRAIPNISVERPTSVSPRPGQVAEQNLIESNLLHSREDINNDFTNSGESSSSGQLTIGSPRRKRESEASDSQLIDSPTKKIKSPKKDDK